jgi:uroporphyrinogen-III synthase
MSLSGKRIVVTRAPHQAGELADLLRERGGEPLLYPCIAIAPPEESASLDAALQQAAAGGFDWLVVTSGNTVEALRQRCEALDLSLAGLRTAAVGPATAEAARSVLDLDVQAMPDEHVAEALADSLGMVAGQQILLPQANLARATLADQLAAAGADITVVTAYCTVMGQGGVDLPALLKSGAVDALTFTSSSTVDNCLTRVEQANGETRLLREICAVCIGPKTADTASDAGFTAIVVPDVYTLPGLIVALEAHLGLV